MTLKPLQTICLLVSAVYCNSKNCCFPDQFDAKVDLLKDTLDATGKQSLEKAYFEISFDTSGKRIYIDKTIQAGNETIRTSTLKLYKEKLQYSVVNNSCTAANLTEWKNRNCIPGRATQLNQYRLTMNSSIVVQDYSWKVGEISHNMTVTGDACIPIFKQVTGKVFGVTVRSTFKFDDVIPRIIDLHVFDVPDICKGLKLNGFKELYASVSQNCSDVVYTSKLDDAELDLVNRDPNNINDHLRDQFEDVIAEPAGVHAIECVS